MGTQQAEAEPKYDETEALHLLGQYAAKHKSFAKDKERAAEELRRALLGMHERAGFLIKSTNDGGIELHLTGQSRRVSVLLEEDTVQVQSVEPRGDPMKVKLHYNPATKLLEGEEDDGFLTPEPGKPKSRKRSAVAVVIQAALDAMDQPPRDKQIS